MGEAATKNTNKETFFKGLEELDDLTDNDHYNETGDGNGDDFSRLIDFSRRSVEDPDSTPSFVPTSSSSSGGLELSYTNTVPDSSLRSEMASRANEMLSTAKRQLPLKTAKAIGTLSERKQEGPPCKKRRIYAARTVPERQQIFKGLVFCQSSPSFMGAKS